MTTNLLNLLVKLQDDYVEITNGFNKRCPISKKSLGKFDRDIKKTIIVADYIYEDMVTYLLTQMLPDDKIKILFLASTVEQMSIKKEFYDEFSKKFIEKCQTDEFILIYNDIINNASEIIKYIIEKYLDYHLNRGMIKILSRQHNIVSSSLAILLFPETHEKFWQIINMENFKLMEKLTILFKIAYILHYYLWNMRNVTVNEKTLNRIDKYHNVLKVFIHNSIFGIDFFNMNHEQIITLVTKYNIVLPYQIRCLIKLRRDMINEFGSVKYDLIGSYLSEHANIPDLIQKINFDNIITTKIIHGTDIHAKEFVFNTIVNESTLIIEYIGSPLHISIEIYALDGMYLSLTNGVIDFDICSDQQLIIPLDSFYYLPEYSGYIEFHRALTI